LIPFILKVSSDFTDVKIHNLAGLLLFFFLPQILFYGLYAILSQVCGASKAYSAILWAPVVNNIVVISAFIFLLARREWILDLYNHKLVIAYLGSTATLGVLLQMLVLFVALRQKAVKFTFSFSKQLISFKELFAVAYWSIMFTLTNQIYSLLLSKLTTAVNSRVALHHSGGIGYTSYMNSYLIIMMFHSIIMVTVINRVQPSIAASVKDKKKLLVTLHSLERIVCTFVLPVSIYLTFFGNLIMELLFTHGNDSILVHYIGLILQMMGPGLALYSLQFVYLRYFYIHKDLKRPFYINLVISCIENAAILLSYFLFPLLWRVPMMALSFSICYLLGATLTLLFLKRRILKWYSPRSLITWFTKSTALSIASCILTKMAIQLLQLIRLFSFSKTISLFIEISFSLSLFTVVLIILFNTFYMPLKKISSLFDNIANYE
jgi:putative peptidoglycan lipid II flippase